MKLYNTKSRELENFKPLRDKEVKVYYCWPTVYNYAHIWNLRTFIFEDIVVKTLKFLWYHVLTTMNITDVDDKTIRDSVAAWEDLLSFTQRYTDAFLDDIRKLWITPADNVVPVTTLIPEMVRMIQTMLNRKHAYLSDDGSIYFEVKSFKKYWELAHLDMKWMKSWIRIDNDEYDKETAADFVLWKAWKDSDGDNFWEEEFIIPPTNSLLTKEGEPKRVVLKWRPGWHIECSACNMKCFGQQIDIHMWWVDLIFPHHQNEIAQSEACTRKEFTKYWLHSWHLMVDGKKMAKSAGNFYTLRDIEEKFSDTNSEVLYRAIRLWFMNAKYSSGIDFSFDKLESNIQAIHSIDEFIKNLNREINIWNSQLTWISRDFRDFTQEIMQDYIIHLEDDFNIPEALAVFHHVMKFVNTAMREKQLSHEELSSIIDLLKSFNEVLWIIDFDINTDENNIPEDILEKFEKRNQAKSQKDFALADSLRDDLLKLWYKIVDDRNGSRLEK